MQWPLGQLQQSAALWSCQGWQQPLPHLLLLRLPPLAMCQEQNYRTKCDGTKAITRSGTTRACCTDVWLAALVWLDAGDRAPSRLPSVVAARLSATWNGQAIQGKVILA